MYRLSPRFIKFALLLTPVLGFGASPKIARDLDGVSAQATVPVIVQFASSPDNAQKQKLKNHGGRLRRELGMIRSAAYTLPAAALNALANDPQVVYIGKYRRSLEEGARSQIGGADHVDG